MAKKRIKSESSPAAHVATQLARQAKRTLGDIQEADTAKDYGRMTALEDRLHALEAELSWHQIGSPEAALLALGVASDLARQMADMFPHESGKVDALIRTSDRLLGSLTRYVESLTGVRCTDFGFDYYRASCDRVAWGGLRG